ncbi:hypothetical protein BH09ACT10_BH09ACT10_07760 [soil metagenome]
MTILAVVGTLLGSAFALNTPANAAPVACWDSVRTDLDGGGPDVVVGLPSYDLPGKPDAGAIVLYSNVASEGSSEPSKATKRTLITADDLDGLASQSGARFGAAVTIWNEGGDPDDCGNVLIGAPGQTVGGKTGAGQVYLVAGSATGLNDVVSVLDEDSIIGAGGAQGGAAFGASIAVEDASMVAIGAPKRNIGAVKNAGHVIRLDYRLSATPDVLVVQQGAGSGVPETEDRFGEVLDTYGTGEGPVLLIGIPREDIGKKTDAGAVGMQPPIGPLTMVNQDSPGAAGAAERGDRFGAAIDSYSTFDVDHPVIKVAVGVPGEDVGSASNVGAVAFAEIDLFVEGQDAVSPLTGTSRTLTQATRGVAGSNESGDAFGSSVVVGELGAERLRLAAGAPGENVGKVVDAGLVTLVTIDPVTAKPTGGSQPGSWGQNSPGVNGKAERGDAFGSSLSGVQLTTVQEDDDVVWAILLATAPGENSGSVSDSGTATLGGGPGHTSVPLSPPVVQKHAGRGMAAFRMLLG